MRIEPVQRIHGSIRLPGDKSIAHRALILGALSTGKHIIDGLPRSADVASTAKCLRILGAFIEEMPDGRTLVLAKPPRSNVSLFAGNSGTTARPANTLGRPANFVVTRRRTRAQDRADMR